MADKRIKGTRHREIYALFDRLTARAYRCHWLAANPVLARSPYTQFVRRYVRGDDAPARWYTALLKGFLLYYLNNLKPVVGFIRSLCFFRSNGVPRLKKSPASTIVNGVVYMNRQAAESTLSLPEYPGLIEAMRERGTPVAVAPLIHEAWTPEFLEAMTKLVRTNNVPILAPASVCSPMDILRLLAFFLGYPFALARFLAALDGQDGKESLVRDECCRTMGSDVVTPYLRYLHGRGLARISPDRFTAICWCENRAGDKLFCKGLRAEGKKVDLLGMQLFIFPDNYLASYINNSENDLGYAPDKLYVNGSYYLPTGTHLNADVGPSLRYSHVFAPAGEATKRTDTLVLFPYDRTAASELLTRLIATDLPETTKLVLRCHPGAAPARIGPLLERGATLSEGSLQEAFAKAAVVIGSESGTLMEAIASTVPVVNVDTLGEESLGYLPESGKGEIWFPATTPEDIQKYRDTATALPKAVRGRFATQYRQLFFNDMSPQVFLDKLGL